MTDDDPVPLKAGGEASPELVRALYALGKSGPDAARLARVAEKLGTALTDAPPAGTGSSSGVRKLFGTKTLITGIVVGLAALSWLGYQLAGRHQNDAPAKPPQPAAVEVSSREPAPSQVREAESPHASVAAPAPQPSDAVGYAGAVRRSGRRAKPAQGSAVASSASSASSAASQPVAVAPAA